MAALDPTPPNPLPAPKPGELPWLDDKGALLPTYTLQIVDPKTYARNQYGFLLNYKFPVPRKADGTPILTKADLALAPVKEEAPANAK